MHSFRCLTSFFTCLISEFGSKSPISANPTPIAHGKAGLTGTVTVSAFVSNELLYSSSYLTRFRKYTLEVRTYHSFASTDLASVENILGFVRFFT